MKAEMDKISALYDQGKLEEARTLCEALAAKSRQDDRISYALGMICQKLGDVPAALDAYATTVEISPNHMPALVNLGSLLISFGKPDLAIDPLQSALLLDPNGFPARYNLARALFETGQVDQALEEALLARELEDEVHPLHDLLEKIYLKKNDATKAGFAARRRDQLIKQSKNGAAGRH